MNTSHYQKLLEKEKENLENELKTVGRVNPENPNDWQPTPDQTGDINDDPDSSVVADAVESFESRSAIEVVLENRLKLVRDALNRINSGTYGICEKGGEEIEKDRLEANPSATTCKTHMEDGD